MRVRVRARARARGRVRVRARSSVVLCIIIPAMFVDSLAFGQEHHSSSLQRVRARVQAKERESMVAKVSVDARC